VGERGLWVSQTVEHLGVRCERANAVGSEEEVDRRDQARAEATVGLELLEPQFREPV
jgi:hypothetical protein